jgi:hypothetical protein
MSFNLPHNSPLQTADAVRCALLEAGKGHNGKRRLRSRDKSWQGREAGERMQEMSGNIKRALDTSLQDPPLATLAIPAARLAALALDVPPQRVLHNARISQKSPSLRNSGPPVIRWHVIRHSYVARKNARTDEAGPCATKGQGSRNRPRGAD